jgi:hypothetical protein
MAKAHALIETDFGVACTCLLEPPVEDVLVNSKRLAAWPQFLSVIPERLTELPGACPACSIEYERVFGISMTPGKRPPTHTHGAWVWAGGAHMRCPAAVRTSGHTQTILYGHCVRHRVTIGTAIFSLYAM